MLFCVWVLDLLKKSNTSRYVRIVNEVWYEYNTIISIQTETKCKFPTFSNPNTPVANRSINVSASVHRETALQSPQTTALTFNNDVLIEAKRAEFRNEMQILHYSSPNAAAAANQLVTKRNRNTIHNRPDNSLENVSIWPRLLSRVASVLIAHCKRGDKRQISRFLTRTYTPSFSCPTMLLKQIGGREPRVRVGHKSLNYCTRLKACFNLFPRCWPEFSSFRIFWLLFFVHWCPMTSAGLLQGGSE